MIEESVTIRAGLKKRLHVDQARIRRNTKTGSNDPPITVQARGGPYKAHRAVIDGPSELVYEPEDPLSCGARLWIFTEAEVHLTVDG